MAKDSKVFAKNEVVQWSGEGREGNYRIASVNKTKKTANMRGLGSTKAKVPFKAIPWSELTHTKDIAQMSYERYRSMEDGGSITKSELEDMFKDDGDSWKNDKEFFKIASDRGFDYDQDKEEFVMMETFNDSPYGDEYDEYAKGGAVNNYDWKSKPLTLRTSDWEKRINYPRYHNFNGKTYNLIYNFDSRAEALRKIKDIGMTDTILQPIKYSDGKGGGLPKYFVYVSTDSADQYAKGGSMASGGLFDSEGRRYSKKRGEFLTSEWFSGDLDFLNY